MRFVRIKSAMGGNIKNIERKCIASADVRINKCTETDKETKKLNRALKGEYNFTYSEGKLRRKFSLKKTVEFVKREVVALYDNLNKKTAAYTCAAMAVLAFALVFNINFSFAYNAFLGNTELGYVPNKAYVQQCVDSINNEFAQYVSGEDILSGEIIYVPAIVRRGGFTDATEVEENIKSTSDVMTLAYAVEVDGMAYAALDNKKEAESILTKIAYSYKSNENTEVEFKEDVRVLYEYVPMSIVLSAEYAEQRLSGYKTVYNTVVPKGGIAVSDFATQNGLEVEYLKAFNPDLGEYTDEAQEIVIPDRKPIITVVSYDTVSYDTELPYDEEVTEDATMYEGAEKVVQVGVEGVSTITERIERTNGTITNQSVVNSVVKSEPVTQMIAVGTKYRPAHIGTGTFLRPYYGMISSRFGSRRSGNHTGVDFCGNVGDPIIAADSGTVIFSGWSGGYGNIIKIDHNNGYITYYAHCSELYAQVGDVVQKGDTIAALGNTGNSTGPHVHFEIHNNDSVEDPMKYVD